MCYRTTCPKCQKATWGGCGRHIESALAGVPQNQRCTCHEKAQKAAPPKAPEKRASWWPFGK